MHSPQHARGILISILGVFILSPDSLFIRLLELDDFTLIFYRGLLPTFTITLLLILYYRKKFLTVVLATGWAGILNACLFAGTNITFINSIQKTSVANTLVILSSAPVFAAVLSFFVLREKQRSVIWVVMAMSMTGIFIIGFGSYQGDGLAGDLFALACAVTTACSAVLIRLCKHIDLVPSVIFGSLIITFYAWMSAPIASVSSAQFVYIAIIGFVIVPLAFMCLTIAPRFASSAEVQLVFLLESILGPLWVWLVIRETPSTNTLLGGSILLASVAWFAVKSLNKRNPT
jgi:drug/metabolite transporter (DMT)-like permease